MTLNKAISHRVIFVAMGVAIAVCQALVQQDVDDVSISPSQTALVIDASGKAQPPTLLASQPIQ